MEQSGRVVIGTTTLVLLGVVSVTLRLCHVINWSWWWITLPFWIGPMSLMIFLAVVALIVCAAALL